MSIAAYTLILTNGVSFSLVAGARVAVNFGGNGGVYLRSMSSLNVNSTGAKSVVKTTSGGSSGYYYYSYTNNVCEFVYDGTAWHMTSTFVYIDTE